MRRPASARSSTFRTCSESGLLIALGGCRRLCWPVDAMPNQCGEPHLPVFATTNGFLHQARSCTSRTCNSGLRARQYGLGAGGGRSGSALYCPRAVCVLHVAGPGADGLLRPMALYQLVRCCWCDGVSSFRGLYEFVSPGTRLSLQQSSRRAV